MTSSEQVFRSIKSPMRLLSDDLVNQTRDMLSKLVEMREMRNLSVSDVADLMGMTDEEILEFESYTSDPHLDDVVRYALAVEARIAVDVTDGRAWAKRELTPRESNLISGWITTHVPESDDAKYESAYV
jgi:transcriptional regulator with XRE-family HTH domain